MCRADRPTPVGSTPCTSIPRRFNSVNTATPRRWPGCSLSSWSALPSSSSGHPPAGSTTRRRSSDGETSRDLVARPPDGSPGIRPGNVGYPPLRAAPDRDCRGRITHDSICLGRDLVAEAVERNQNSAANFLAEPFRLEQLPGGLVDPVFLWMGV